MLSGRDDVRGYEVIHLTQWRHLRQVWPEGGADMHPHRNPRDEGTFDIDQLYMMEQIASIKATINELDRWVSQTDAKRWVSQSVNHKIGRKETPLNVTVGVSILRKVYGFGKFRK